MNPDTQNKAINTRRPPAQRVGGRRIARSPHRRRLSCPFHAKFPEKSRGSNSSCNGTGFKTCARLVEHLKRAHGPLELSDKATAPAGHPQAIAADGEEERLTNEQLALIAKLPRNPNPDQKWVTIYKIIFPGDEASKPTYMPSAEQLRNYARDPPDWLLTNLIDGGIGESHQEIIMTLKKFLIFFDIVGGSPSSLLPSMVPPPLIQPGQSSTTSESLVETHFMVDDMKGMDESFDAEAVYSLEGYLDNMNGNFDFGIVNDIGAFCTRQGYIDTDMVDISGVPN